MKLSTGTLCVYLSLAALGGSAAYGGSIDIGTANNGNCYPFNCNDSGSASGKAIEYQQVYRGSLFGASPVSITSIAFSDQFLSGFGFSNVPLLGGSYVFSFAVTNKSIGGLSATLADNITSGQATFLSVTTGGIVAGFSTLSFNGSTPYVFNPGSGNLLLDIIVTNQANVSSASYDPANGFDADDTGTDTSRAFQIGGQLAGSADSSALVTTFAYDVVPTSTVPEPSTYGLMGGGLLLLLAGRKRTHMTRKSLQAGGVAVAALLAVALPNHAAAQLIQGRTISIPLHTPAGVTTNAVTDVISAPVTIPNWSKTYTIGGRDYPQKFVGTDPAVSAVTTTISVPVVPVRIVLNNGAGPVFDPTKKLNTAPAGSALSAMLATLTSPLFQNATYTTGGTTVGTGVQFGDAIQRATWWSTVSTTAPNWHTVLHPQLQPTITLNVPVASGSVSGPFALVDINWLGPALDKLAPNYGAANFPLFLVYEVLQTDNGGASCCILGYHTAVQTVSTLQTYAMGTYLDPFQIGGGASDISVLTHEVSEWLNDPFVNNIVPDWPAPFSFIVPGPSYSACQNNLETGDPIEDRSNPAVVVFKITTMGRQYTLQNEALVPWFVHASPSFSVNGGYTYLGPIDNEFTTFAPRCPTPPPPPL